MLPRQRSSGLSTHSTSSSDVALSSSIPTSHAMTTVADTTTSQTTTTTTTTTTTSTTTTTTTTSTSTTPTATSSSTTTSQTTSSTSTSTTTSLFAQPLASSTTTTQPSIPTSSSQQGSVTTITSSITTYVNGSPVPTSYATTIPQISTPTSSTRTAIIAGSAAGGTALLILILSLAFFARRKQFKRLDFLHAISLKRKRERSRATLLDGGDDDLDLARPPRPYTDYGTPWDTAPRTRSQGVWPTPAAHEATRLIDDPIAHDPDLDLGRIVEDVMGPSPARVHFEDRSVSSVYRGSVAESDGVVHSRTVSDASNIALLEAAGLGTAPVKSSPLAQSGTKPRSSSVEHDTR